MIEFLFAIYIFVGIVMGWFAIRIDDGDSRWYVLIVGFLVIAALWPVIIAVGIFEGLRQVYTDDLDTSVKCTHKKVYEDIMLPTYPPKQRWICELCGMKGIDTHAATVAKPTYDEIEKLFSEVRHEEAR